MHQTHIFILVLVVALCSSSLAIDDIQCKFIDDNGNVRTTKWWFAFFPVDARIRGDLGNLNTPYYFTTAEDDNKRQDVKLITTTDGKENLVELFDLHTNMVKNDNQPFEDYVAEKNINREEYEGEYQFKIKHAHAWFNDKSFRQYSSKTAHSKFGIAFNVQKGRGFYLTHTFPDCPMIQEDRRDKLSFFPRSPKLVLSNSQHAFCYSFENPKPILDIIEYAMPYLTLTNVPKSYSGIGFADWDSGPAFMKKLYDIIWPNSKDLQQITSNCENAFLETRMLLKNKLKMTSSLHMDWASVAKLEEAKKKIQISQVQQLQAIWWIENFNKLPACLKDKELEPGYTIFSHVGFRGPNAPGESIFSSGLDPWLSVAKHFQEPLYVSTFSVPESKIITDPEAVGINHQKYGIFPIESWYSSALAGVPVPIAQETKQNQVSRHEKLGFGVYTNRVCIGDLNRQKSHFFRSGMTFCINSITIRTFLEKAAYTLANTNFKGPNQPLHILKTSNPFTKNLDVWRSNKITTFEYNSGDNPEFKNPYSATTPTATSSIVAGSGTHSPVASTAAPKASLSPSSKATTALESTVQKRDENKSPPMKRVRGDV